MKAKIDWKAFSQVNDLSTSGLMRGEADTLTDEDVEQANAALQQAREIMHGVQTLFDAARHNWRNRHLSHRPPMAQTIDA